MSVHDCQDGIPTGMIQRTDRVTLLALVAAVFISILWLSVGVYQSHYIIGLRLLGDVNVSTLIGVAKEGRGDEWSTYLPMLKQAALEGFPAQSLLEPYREKLNWFIAIPKWDFSLFFLPHQVLFWVNAPFALSFSGIYYNLLIVVSVYWLLRNFGVKQYIALTAALMLLFSHFYQVWWTSNFPILGSVLLPYAILTSDLRRRVKYPLLFWSFGHMLFGQVYPPFIIPVALALIPIIAVMHPRLINRKDIFLAGLSAALALACFVYGRFDFVQAVSGTSYPGVRHEVGGDGTVQLLLSTIFPTMPFGLTNGSMDTVHEMSTISTFFPVLFAALLPQINWNRKTIILTVVSAIMLAIMSLYVTIGFPRSLANLTGFYLVPARRMSFGIALLVMFYTVIIVSMNWKRMNWIGLLVSVSLYFAVSYLLGTRQDAVTEFRFYRWFWLTPVVMIIAFYALNRFFSIPATLGAGAALLSVSLMQVFVYGSFNPLMKAKDILTPVHSQLTNDVKALVKANNGRPVAVLGNYGHLLRGEGLPVLNAIHLVNVDAAVYKQYLGVKAADLDRIFNRFVGIMFTNTKKAIDDQITVSFPVEGKTVSFEHTINHEKLSSQSLIDHSPSVTTTENDDGTIDTYWSAVLNQPVPIDDSLNLSLPCEINSSWLTRYPVMINQQNVVDEALQGVAGRVTLPYSDSKLAIACVQKLIITHASQVTR